MRLNAINDLPITGRVEVPRSKPHMQRALVLALLTKGQTTIRYPSWSSETGHLLKGLQQFGLQIIEKTQDRLVLLGVGNDLRTPGSPVLIDGSANMCRIVIAISLLTKKRFQIHGNSSMAGRPLDDYLEELSKSGFQYLPQTDENGFKLQVTGNQTLNSMVSLNVDKTSQYMTSVLLVSPLFGREIRIRRKGSKIVSRPYTELTVDMMRKQGVVVDEIFDGYRVNPGQYSGTEIVIPSDFTSLSYIFGIALIAKTALIRIPYFNPSMMNAEKKFFSIMNQIGLRTEYDDEANELVIVKEKADHIHLIIDAGDIPTVVPSLIAMAPFVSGSMRLHGASHVNNHKSERLTVMIDEMKKMGFSFTKYYLDNHNIDGFVTHGPQKPFGADKVTSKGDHRNFMSLLVASLGTESPGDIDGENHIHASYPFFMDNLKNLGLRN